MKHLAIIIITFLLTFKVSAQWIYQNTNIDGLNTAIFFTDSLTGYLGGTHFNDYILKTTNGGTNWNEYQINGHPTSLFFVNKDTGYCSTSYDHYIYRTTNGGENWGVIYSDSLPIWDIYFLNDSLGWAVGGEYWSKGLILKTTDKGNSWQRMLLPINNYCAAIKMSNDSVGFIVGGDPMKIWKTENGGNYWDLVLQDYSSSNQYDISLINDSIGFAVGSKLFKTSDGGVNWEEFSLPLLSYRSVFTYNNKCWITASGFNYSHILYTSDYGLNWIPINSPIHAYNSFFINDSLGWFCGMSNNVLKTYSGGLITIINPSIPNLVHPTQNEINVDIPVEFEWMDQDYCYFQIQVGNDSIFNSIIVDTILIENKVFVDSSYLNPYTNYFWKVRASNIVGFSDWSDIGKFTTGLVSGVSDKAILSAFTLEQNYPNPFNPSTNIIIRITERTKVTLTIFNLLGQVTNVLMDEEKNPGEYEIKFIPSNISSGVFIYQLRTSTGVINKKMTYIK
jgi:photosystem II stability/assembly factor-like uncharacterized protein